MAEWLNLTEVAASAGSRLRPVAWRQGEMVSHHCFVQDVMAWQAAFEAHPGRRFAFNFSDAYVFAAALFGAWHAGKQVYLPGDTQPETVARLAPLVDGWAGEHPHALQPWPEAVARARASLDLRDTSVVIYTSGTHGEPVAIVKRLDQLDAEVRALQQVFAAPLEASSPVMVYSTVSHQHIYGLLFYILWPLAAGRPLVAERLAFAEQLAARLRGGPAILVSSPAHLGRLPEGLDWRAARQDLRAVFSSGGPLSAEAALACLDALGQSPREVFGSSETGGIAWRQRAVHGDRWRGLPGVDWQISGGLLEVRSSHLASAAWWLTSDRAAPDHDGGFVVLGRADRIVKVEEKRVSLTAMEAVLNQCTDIAEARVFLLPTPAGPKLAVVAVPTPAGWAALCEMGKRAFSERLRDALLNVVERIALPRRWRYRRAMPANLQGKTTEALLAAAFRPLLPQAEWLQREVSEARAALAVSPDLAVFDGHFDQQPVLPGVAQLGWAIEMAHSCFVLPPQFLRVDALKFLRPVLPPAALELHLSWRKESGQLSFQFASAAGVHSSGRVLLGDA